MNNKNLSHVIFGVLLTIALIVLVACGATNKTNSLISGNTYYVSLAGSDLAACTATSPCRTYQRAEALASAGDTISFARNTYPAFTITKAVAVFGNGSPINSSTVNGITITSDNVTVSGFEVANSRDFGIFTDKKNFIIENNIVYNTVKNNNSTATTCKNPASGWGSAIKVKVGGQNGVIRNNTVYENCGEGIAVTRGVNVLVEGNRVYDNYSVNIYVDNSQDVTVRNNISYCTGKYQRNGANANAYSLGEEFYSGWGYRLENIQVLNNSGRDCKRGIYVAESASSSSVYNNITISNNDFSSGQVRAISLDSRNSNVLISNNIIFNNPWIAYPNGVTLLNNVFAGTPTWTMTPPLSTLKPPSATATRTAGAITATRASTATPRPSTTNTHVMQATNTPQVNFTNSPEPTLNPDNDIPPFRQAELCSDTGENHDNTLFHTLWDGTRGCHYEHEHGSNPFTSEVAATFPDFDLHVLLGGVGIGHTNPSSPAENTTKHGGFKWQVGFDVPNPTTGGVCKQGFEGGVITVKDYAIQFHAFGRQDVEHETRNHSSAALLSFCKDGNVNDLGYMYVVQLQEYGERVMPYQGMVLPYPDNFQPTYDGRRGQYFTTECFGQDFNVVDAIRGTLFIDCRPTFSDPANNLTIWSSKPTCSGQPCLRPPGSNLFTMLFRSRDNYQRLDALDLVHPFTWKFVCGGTNYNPVGCRFNSSTFTIHEIAGVIPAAWDGASFDGDPRVGRVTFEGFVSRFGDKLTELECTQAGGNCYPIKLVAAFVGKYSSEISINKVSNPTPENTPERDRCFTLAGVLINCDLPGAIPSGWIGASN